MKILIIDGSNADISAALRLREAKPDTQTTVLIKDGYPNFSVCGLPFCIDNEIND